MAKLDIDDKTIKEFKNLLEYLNKFSSGGINSIEEKFLLRMLNNSIRFYCYLVVEGVFKKIERITINKNILGSNKRIHTISQLKYPPANFVKNYGRCNLPKQSIFYGTFAWLIALNEIKPSYGDLITRTIWINQKDKPLKYCPIFLNQPSADISNPRIMEYSSIFMDKVDKLFPEKAAEIVVDLFQFISNSFAKRIETNNYRDYLFSAFFADKILYDFEDGRIDAIYYPSVKNWLSFENIAIKPNTFDEIYKLSEIHEKIIVQVPNQYFNGYLMEGIAECKSFNYTTDEVHWENSISRYDPEKIEATKRKFNLDLD